MLEERAGGVIGRNLNKLLATQTEIIKEDRSTGLGKQGSSKEVLE